MAFYKLMILLQLMILCFGVTIVTADRLPAEVKENQEFTIETTLDVIGIIDEETSLSHIISSKNSIPEGSLSSKQIVAVSEYHDTLTTDGGTLSESKSFSFDSGNQKSSGYNTQNEKVLTYSGINGSHLVGEETMLLDIAGTSTSNSSTTIRCIFSETEKTALPAFCDIVKTTSKFVNVNSGQISSDAGLRSVASSKSTSAGVSYKIAVSPDTQSGISANGSVLTEFVGHILEGRDNEKKTSKLIAADNSWKDETAVSGEIASLQKVFSYESGMKL